MACRTRGSGLGRSRLSGQALVEFAIVLPVLIALLGGVIQFSLLFWAQNTLTQVVRNTGRWAATQEGCWLPNDPNNTTGAPTVDVAGEANSVAANSSLLGYSSASPWAATPESSDAGIAGFSTALHPDGIAVAWIKGADPTNEGCPPIDTQASYHVTIRINHTVPVFMPGMQYLPGLGTCTSSGCSVVLSSTAQYQVEPAP